MAQTKSAAGKSLKVWLDSMTEHDLLEVVEIEAICGLSPWGWDSYHRELGSGREAVMLVARIDVPQPFVAEGMRIAGFVVSRVIAGELHINNIAVRKSFTNTVVSIWQAGENDIMQIRPRTLSLCPKT